MGVPGLYKFLKQDLKKVVYLKRIAAKIDYLYFDLNAYIYKSYYEVSETEMYTKEKKVQFENDIIINVIANMKNIVDEINPTTNVFIAIDGLVPLAKIRHQRDRRYSKELAKQINTVKETEWSLANISPGTYFMNKLENAIREDELFMLDYFIFSPSSEEGEGEHKIVKYIQNIHSVKSKKEKEMIKRTHVILGDDGDIIHLSLFLLNTIPEASFYIMRQNKEWIHIKELNKIVNNNMGKEKSILDFIFMCMLLGNDFLPRLPSLSMYRDGIPILIDTYKECIANHTNTNTVTESFSFLSISSTGNITFEQRNIYHFLKLLAEKENDHLKHQHTFFMTRKVPYKKRQDIEYIKENMYNHKIKFPLTGNQQEKQAFKKIYLNSKNLEKEYMDMVFWTMCYYIGNPVDWNAFYPKHHAPFISDIVSYLSTTNYEYQQSSNNNKNIRLVDNNILQQLLILPPSDICDNVEEAYHHLLQTDSFANYFDYRKYNYYADYCHKYFLSIFIFHSIDYKKFHKCFYEI